MEILHFSVDYASHTLTLYMHGMPQGDPQTNISVGGQEIGYTSKSVATQTITCSTADVTRSGKIMVIMVGSDGEELQAWSSEEYVTKPDDHGYHPLVYGAIPQEAAPGDFVTLQGMRLKHVDRVALGPRRIPNNPAISDASIRIRIPEMSPGTYPVILWGKVSAGGGA